MSDLEPVPESLLPLASWLRDRQPGTRAVELTGIRRASSGFSADTVIVDCVIDGADAEARVEQRVVLRTESPDPPIYPVQVPGWKVEIELQYRVMDALARHSTVPVADLIGYEPDPSVLGTQFFVMGYVDGQVPIENPPYTSEGFFLAATPGERGQLIEEGLQLLARFHTLDWRAAGLEWLVTPGTPPGLATQLDIWERYARAELRDREHPLLERAFAWLRANRPPEGAPGLCWGDPRPGNIIWRGFTPACTTDFEAASIAPPELDLGWWLMFDRTMHEVIGAERPTGDPSREEQLAIYERAAGRTVDDIRYYEICAAARYCAIVVRVMNRAEDRGLMPPDHRIWIENPAVSALEMLFDDA
jgi:aminoglycoside phosphotransferase (APT) family kinase protein